MKTLDEWAKRTAHVFAAYIAAKDRATHGIRTGQQQGKFPVKNREQALSAIRLRHHAKPPLTKAELSNLLTRCAKYAPKEAQQARDRDRKAGKL